MNSNNPLFCHLNYSPDPPRLDHELAINHGVYSDLFIGLLSGSEVTELPGAWRHVISRFFAAFLRPTSHINNGIGRCQARKAKTLLYQPGMIIGLPASIAR